MSEYVDIDLPMDLQTEDETGLPYASLSRANHPGRIIEGAWITVGSQTVNAVARVIDLDGGFVHVEPLPGPARRWLHLLHRQSA